MTDLNSLKTGRVSFVDGRDKRGPLTVAMAVEGKLKDSKAPRSSRLVVFGTSQFANNNFIRYGSNLDLMLNAISWIVEDESLISIRSKDEETGKIELSVREGRSIALLTILLLPLGIAVFGVVHWIKRRRL